jgi:hypothetical protein
LGLNFWQRTGHRFLILIHDSFWSRMVMVLILFSVSKPNLYFSPLLAGYFHNQCSLQWFYMLSFSQFILIFSTSSVRSTNLWLFFYSVLHDNLNFFCSDFLFFCKHLLFFYDDVDDMNEGSELWIHFFYCFCYHIKYSFLLAIFFSAPSKSWKHEVCYSS